MKTKTPRPGRGIFYKQLALRCGKGENDPDRYRDYIILNALTNDVARKGNINVTHSQ